MRRAMLMCLSVVMCCLGYVSVASAQVTPGWECVPAAAGSAVVSGGTGNSPSCAAGSTAVLAPTYVSSGVGGKPTVEFSTMNVQVVSGSGATDGTRNGEGNLVVGYAENPNSLGRTGSNNLVVGSKGGWTGYGNLIAGVGDQAANSYSAVFGDTNIARGSGELLGGAQNSAWGKGASITGGLSNQAAGADASVTGGELNYARDLASSVTGGCQNVTGSTAPPAGTCPSSGTESVTGGNDNTASGLSAAITGGQLNQASDPFSFVADGCDNRAGTTGTTVDPNRCVQRYQSITGGDFNTVSGKYATISAGEYNTASGYNATISGGYQNTAPGTSATISAGGYNTAAGSVATVSGGTGNIAGDVSTLANGQVITDGDYSSITGGQDNHTASGATSILGGLNETLSSNPDRYGFSVAGATLFSP